MKAKYSYTFKEVKRKKNVWKEFMIGELKKMAPPGRALSALRTRAGSRHSHQAPHNRLWRPVRSLWAPARTCRDTYVHIIKTWQWHTQGSVTQALVLHSGGTGCQISEWGRASIDSEFQACQGCRGRLCLKIIIWCLWGKLQPHVQTCSQTHVYTQMKMNLFWKKNLEFKSLWKFEGHQLPLHL